MTTKRHLLLLLMALALAPATPALARTASADLLAAASAQGTAGHVPVIITLADKVDLTRYPGLSDRETRALMIALRLKASTSQAALLARLNAAGSSQIKQLWSINSVAAMIPSSLIPELEADPSIESVRLDAIVHAPVTASGTTTTPEWNLDAVKVPGLWALGYTGAGVVVANMDSGVDYRHPDLTANWRGGSNSWYDPNGQHISPYDRMGHGTQTMGLMVGGNVGGSNIGTAPDAQWIAVKIFDDYGNSTLSKIHLGFQWLLDPDGNPNTADAPDVVNNSWGLLGTTNLCNLEFQNDIQVLKAAGIGVVFAAGNEGPSSLTSVSPANNPAGFPAGAVDDTLTLANFSSRGPSACDGGTFPKLVAPGVNVKTSDLSLRGMANYAYVSGTSFAAPHVAGVMALLAGAFPNASVAALEAAMVQSAQDLGPVGPDSGYGRGLVDARAAYDILAGVTQPTNQAPVATDDAYAMNAGATLTVAAPGLLGNDSDPDGDPITAQLDTAPTHGTLTLAPDGGFGYTPDAGYAGSDSFTYVARDGSLASAVATVTINVAAMVNQAPTATADAYGTQADTPLNVPAPGLLGNDSDPDGNAITAQLATAPAHGSLNLAADGSFIYTPEAGYVGSDGFTYTAFDGSLASAPTNVTIDVAAPVNQPPVAVGEAYTMQADATLTVPSPGVLGNDSDPEGSPLSAQVATAPAHGSLTLAADGSFVYVPSAGYFGSDSFRYVAHDGTQASAPATVSITVNSNVNQPPVAVNDAATVIRNTTTTIAVLANDSDPEGALDPATVTITVKPNRYGSATVNADGTVRYTPRRNYVGTETFKYTVKDQAGKVSNAATVTVTVKR